MTNHELNATTALVTGASRGFGRAVAAALLAAGADVIGVARDRATLERTAAELGDRFTPVVGDAADPYLADHLLRTHRPHTVILNAGATPTMAPLTEQTWESFSRPWQVDVRQALHWSQAALLLPLAPGSTVISLSSGAALRGSALSGGYAGAKATVRFIAAYAADESARAGFGVRFTAVLPKLTPVTDLGADAVAAYARRAGLDVEAFLAASAPVPTLESVTAAVLELAADPGYDRPAYLLVPTGGLRPVDPD